MISDSLGRKLMIPKIRKIVSLCPSISRTLIDLGVGHLIAGLTDYCEPFSDNSYQRIGGPRDPDTESIIKINPDIILADYEENTKECVSSLEKKLSVVVFHIKSLSDSLSLISKIGSITKRDNEAGKILAEISYKWAGIYKKTSPQKTLYLLWKEPWMAAGGNTYTGQVMNHIGLSNIMGAKEAYPVIEELSGLQEAGSILLPSEPFHFTERDIGLIRGELPTAGIKRVSGEAFCWYGTYMLKAADELNSLCNDL